MCLPPKDPAIDGGCHKWVSWVGGRVVGGLLEGPRIRLRSNTPRVVGALSLG